MMTSLSRKASVLLVAVLLATTAVSAAPLRAHPALMPIDPLAQLWNVLTSLWTKNGCSADPDGRCLSGSTVTTDNGCSVDPSGRCLPGASATTVTPKNGCQVDPNGRCLPGTVTTKNGCQVDPDGRCLTSPTAKTTLDNGCSADPNGRCVK
jgi:hypothetical protein